MRVQVRFPHPNARFCPRVRRLGGLRRIVLARDSILRFVWNEYPKYRNRYRNLELDPAWTHLEWITLRTPRAVRAWLG